MRPTILCFGEILWDFLPEGLFPGGAPFNVASHLHALGVPVGMVSRVGADVLGTEALRRLARNGIATDLVQIDPEHATGMVAVTLDRDGTPSYQIVRPAAWDFIELRPGLLERAARAAAIVFGSLAQRDPVTRATLERLCEVEVPKVFDVNLRPPHDDIEIVRESLEMAEVVKLNEEELGRMASWFGLPTGLRPTTSALAERFRVVVGNGEVDIVAMTPDEHLSFSQVVQVEAAIAVRVPAFHQALFHRDAVLLRPAPVRPAPASLPRVW